MKTTKKINKPNHKLKPSELFTCMLILMILGYWGSLPLLSFGYGSEGFGLEDRTHFLGFALLSGVGAIIYNIIN